MNDFPGNKYQIKSLANVQYLKKKFVHIDSFQINFLKQKLLTRQFTFENHANFKNVTKLAHILIIFSLQLSLLVELQKLISVCLHDDLRTQ